MCGRFSSSKSTDEIKKRFKIKKILKKNIDKLKKKYNISPNDFSRIVKMGRELEVAKWSMLPDSTLSTFNAKSETIDSSPLWSRCQPCLIPSDSFYEFPNKSIRISLKHHDMFSYAGLYNENCFAIITCPPNKIIREGIHDRMPVILKEDHEETWLKTRDLSTLKPYPDDEMEINEVSKFVNSTLNDGPECWDQPFQWL